MAFTISCAGFSNTIAMENPEHGHADLDSQGNTVYWDQNNGGWVNNNPLVATEEILDDNEWEFIAEKRDYTYVDHGKHKKLINDNIYQLLSLDGGGQRAEIFLITLVAIELLSNKSIHELFDGIGGTSTGGITAVALSYKDPETGKPMSALDVLKMYHHCSREIFRKTTIQGATESINQNLPSGIGKLSQALCVAKHDHKGIETLSDMIVGKNNFEDDKFLTDVFITTVNETTGSKLELFSTRNTNEKEISIGNVLRCTSAAKTYFAPVLLTNPETGEKEVFVDGGHGANNPAYAVFDLLKNNDEKNNYNICIISLGTGDTRTSKSAEAAKSDGILSKTMDTIQHAFTAQEDMINKALLGALSEHDNFKMGGGDFTKVKAHYLTSYIRSQTPPLEPKLHEMDQPDMTNDLLQAGIQQLLSEDGKNVLQSVLKRDVSDEELQNVIKRINEGLFAINLEDARPVTLLGIICSFLNEKEASADFSQEKANDFFKTAIGQNNMNVDEMSIDELKSVLNWTSKLQQINEEHRQETTIASKANATRKSITSKISSFWQTETSESTVLTSHGMISHFATELHEKALKKICQKIRNLNENFSEDLFHGDGLRELIVNFSKKAPASLGLNDEEENSEVAFVEFFKSKLSSSKELDDPEYKKELLILIEGIIQTVQMNSSNSLGLTNTIRNTTRSLVTFMGSYLGTEALAPRNSTHRILIEKLEAFKKEINQ